MHAWLCVCMCFVCFHLVPQYTHEALAVTHKPDTTNVSHFVCPSSRYRLTAREYSGDAGNALSYSKRYNHDGRSFSTADRDQDRYAAGNCGQYYGAGWWFDACLAANLNGRYYHGRYSGVTNGIYWGTWYILTDGRTGERYSFKRVEMKTRPRNFVGTS